MALNNGVRRPHSPPPKGPDTPPRNLPPNLSPREHGVRCFRPAVSRPCPLPPALPRFQLQPDPTKKKKNSLRKKTTTSGVSRGRDPVCFAAVPENTGRAVLLPGRVAAIAPAVPDRGVLPGLPRDDCETSRDHQVLPAPLGDFLVCLYPRVFWLPRVVDGEHDIVALPRVPPAVGDRRR